MEVSKKVLPMMMDGMPQEGEWSGAVTEGIPTAVDGPRASEGEQLLEEVASLTGLPLDWVGAELDRIVDTSGHDSKNLTLDELRMAMLQYLDEMQAQLAEQEAADLDILERMSIPGSKLDH